MSSRILRSPTQSSHKGFQPLRNKNSYGDDSMAGHDNIPLTEVPTNSSTGARKEGASSEDYLKNASTFPQQEEEKKSGLFSGHGGRRRIKKIDSKARTGTDATTVTGLGKFYKKIVGFSPVIRHIVYILPIGALIAIPIVIGATVAKDAKIGGVRLLWFFTWIEIVWLSIWVAKLVAQLLPAVFMFLCGVVSSGTRKYALVIRALEVPISLILWAATALATFQGIMVSAPGNNEDDQGREVPVQHWVDVVRNLLAPALIAAGIYLGEKLIVQLISISYHQRSFERRIKESKRAVHLLGLLYDASRTLFPMYCREFEDEDIAINDSIEALLFASGRKSHRLSGSATPMALIAGIGRFGDKVTSAFGNIASEISGKQVFNPNSAHSIVVEALEKKRSSEALAKRLWMSFVVEGREALYPDDVQEVLGPGRRDEADEAFAALDSDGNGDISLDEMIMKIVELGRDRKAIANSMRDVGQAIGVLDQILTVIVSIIVVFIVIAFQNANFVTTLATAGTTLLSLSFVFAVTTQEFLGSCIFLFVKHPYDVGDRVDIVGPTCTNMVVEQISLLYTIFKRVDNMKMVQVPNIVLNGLWVENVSRSNAMKEQLEMFISFDTTIEDVELLRKEMEAFVRHPDNSRDFQNDIVLECTGIGEMNKLVLKVEIKHKSNWGNETVRAARRSKFMCALVMALRKVPIYAPGGGGIPLGDPGNPSYSVAVSDKEAAEARDSAAEKKEGKRLVPTKKDDPPSDTGKSTGTDAGAPLGEGSEARAAEAMNHRNPMDDAGRDTFGPKGEEDLIDSRNEAIERQRRNSDIDDLKQGLLKRESTRGRRKPGDRLPPISSNVNPGFSVTMPSPIGDGRIDEEAGIEGRLQDYQPYAQQSSAGMSQSQSYGIFPPQARPQGQNPLGHYPTAPAIPNAGPAPGQRRIV